MIYGGCMVRKVFPLLIVLSTFASPLPAVADDDHDRARRALEAGEVLPLARILDQLRPEYPGDVLEVELERDDGRWLYELKLLQPGGKLLKLKVDARDAMVVGIKRRSRSNEQLRSEEKR